jgi:hypothetical protein
MRSLIMEGVRPDDYVGYIRVQVEPSVLLQADNGFGVYVSTNDHFQLDAMDQATGEGATSVLEAAWDPVTERAKQTAQKVIGHVR